MAAKKTTATPKKTAAKRAPSKKTTAAKKTAPAEKPQPSPEELMRLRFEEALARKHGRAGSSASPHDPGHTVVPRSNTKRQRTFRRKSGG